MPYKNQDAEVAAVFADQCTSSARNALHAARAKSQHPALARLLAAVSTAEDIQARRMLMQMRGKIDDTSTHLSALRRKKFDDFASVFPKLAERFGREGSQKTAEALEQFGEVAKNHYDRICAAAEISRDDSTIFFVCRVCGYIAAEFPPARCPVCGAVETKFSAVR